MKLIKSKRKRAYCAKCGKDITYEFVLAIKDGVYLCWKCEKEGRAANG